MNRFSSGSIFKMLLNPSTTIAFGLVGVIVGIVSIDRGSKQEASKAASTYIEKLTELKATQSRLESDIQGFSTKVQALESGLTDLKKQTDDLGKRVAAIENKTPGVASGRNRVLKTPPSKPAR